MAQEAPDLQYKILIVDDEDAIRHSLEMILEYEGYTVIQAANGSEGLKCFSESFPDAVFLDIKMPGLDGLDVLSEMHTLNPSLPVIIVSGHGTIETAVQATRLGAFDFIEKPLEKNRILLTLRNALTVERLYKENVALREKEEEKYQIIGQSGPMKELIEIVHRTGPTTATALITGESGTGKELVARAVHSRSNCARGPFVQVNCAAIPEELIENELFGHEKGSYTGAASKQHGKFEQANEGSIFLDEVADMSVKTQAKVLRVLQEKEFQRVGGNTILKTNARILAATNKNLEQEIEAGRFRDDLFFRLNVVPINVPPLRNRKDDIPLLVKHFVDQFCLENGFKKKKFTAAALDVLYIYHWPGNIRELKNVVERVIILSQSPEIAPDNIPYFAVSTPSKSVMPFDPLVLTLKQYKEQSERYYLVTRLNEFSWNIQKTAEAIDTPRSNLYRKIEQYNIQEAQDRDRLSKI